MIDIADVTSRSKEPSGGKNSRGGKRFKVPKASELLAGNIRDQIIRGKLRDGDQLPAEANLMEQFDVSRPTIREAYRILEAQQLVSVTRGAKGGAVVHAPSPDLIAENTLMVLQAEGVTMTEVYLARNASEPALVRLVATNARKEAPPRLRECLAAEEEALLKDPQAFASALDEFHATLVELAGNRPLRHLYNAISAIIAAHQAIVAEQKWRAGSKEAMQKTLTAGLRSQGKLIDLIEAGEIDKAVAHWRSHNEAAYKMWISNFEDTTVLEVLSRNGA
ncbi:FadR family transcriptional regulator [Spongiibacter nanhainus]|uniref:FadR family transcriptional regulator n=1 Tax=Spongiibacter nanhainus TaxID=2794344 RepID=A0A7T4UP58_9GAMM|nr:GntR family transcriptional regulator [Spongiibacter nanhainus]QQD17313.1 FadR family transcriptional regulator [Spongiibacter nanhainus]